MKLPPRFLVDAYLRKITQRKIIAGPFSGLYYIKKSIGSMLMPKLLGCYEKELHTVIETNSTECFEKIIVIGAGEGYYAVGLAKKWKRPVLAFEEDEQGRQLITRLALINRTSVFVKGRFETDIATKSSNDFILIDIEGGEKELLTPERFLQWDKSSIVVEVHSDALKGLIKERSRYTHHSTFIPIRERTLDDYPFKVPFPRFLNRWWWAAIQEWRSDSIGWLIFEPKA